MNNGFAKKIHLQGAQEKVVLSVKMFSRNSCVSTYYFSTWSYSCCEIRFCCWSRQVKGTFAFAFSRLFSYIGVGIFAPLRMITKDLPVYSVREDRFLPQEPPSIISEENAEKSAVQTGQKKQGQRSSLQKRLFQKTHEQELHNRVPQCSPAEQFAGAAKSEALDELRSSGFQFASHAKPLSVQRRRVVQASSTVSGSQTASSLEGALLVRSVEGQL